MNALSKAGMLRLTVSEGHEQDYIQLAADRIQRLPGVLRVRVEPNFNQIEIAFQHPLGDLLRAIQKVLRTAGSEIVAGKIC